MSDESTSHPGEVPAKTSQWRKPGNLLRSERPAWIGDLTGSLRDFPVRRLLFALVVLLVGIYALSGIYVVNPGEAAVVRRFGLVIQSRVGEGLHYRLPWPVDQLDVVNIATVRRESVGLTEPPGEGHIHDEPMAQFRALTGDTNIIDVEVIIQYQVRDPANYLFNVDFPPHRLIREAVRGSVTNLIAGLPVDQILTTERQRLQDAIRVDAQERLDAYESGLDIVNVNLQKAYPPDEVAEAFRDVASASEDKAKAINEAQGHANSVVPEARGDAQKILADGNAYAAQVVNSANGAAQAFDSVLAEYKASSQTYGQDVTLYRYYLESIEKILSKARVYVVDGNGVNLRLLDDSQKSGLQTTANTP